MKKLQLPAAMLGLTVLLTACPQPPTPDANRILTVVLSGTTTAPVKVTNTSTGAVLFSGTLDATKTFSGIKAGSVVTVEPGTVNGYTAPAAQTVTLDADKTVTLAYQAAQQPGTALNNTVMAGKVTGTDLQLGNAYIGTPSDTFFGKISTTNNSINFDLATLPLPPEALFAGAFEGCAGAQSDPAARMLFTSALSVYSIQGDYLGSILEKVVAGADTNLKQASIVRVYSDRAFTFKGTCVFPADSGTTITENSDITLVKGWNTLVVSGSGNSVDLKNAAGDDRIQLSFLSAAPRVAVDLNSSTLTFVDDKSVTVEADFVQVGGYSGTVSLSTDIPGLSVEPSTLTLPALPTLKAQSAGARMRQERLGTLGLRAQMVSTQLTFTYTATDNLNTSFQLLVKDSAGKQVGGGYSSVQVNRPGITLYASGYNLQLARSSTLKVPVTLQSVGSFSGVVTVSATDLPAGVSVASTEVNLNSYAYAEVSLTGDATVVPGTYPITLTAVGNGRSASTKVDLVVPKPGVGVNIPGYSAVNLPREGQSSIEVNLSSLNGFSGATTLSLEDLPAGVSSTPVTATVTPNTTTTVKLPVTASADAVLGTYTVKVTTPDLITTNYGNTTTAQLNVMPQRTLVGGNGYSMARSGSGLWLATESTTDPVTYDTSTTLARYVQGKLSSSIVVPQAAATRMTSLANGDVLLSGYGAAKAYIVDKEGHSTSVSNPFASSSATFADESDALGRIWFVQTTYTGIGGSTSALGYWDPTTGAVTPVDSSRDYGYSGRFTVSPDGKTLVWMSSYTTLSTKIDALTGTVTTLDFGSSAQGGNVAISQDGTLWLTVYGQLKRVNADGSITTFDDVATGGDLNLIGFDRSSPEMLWGRNYAGVIKLNTSTMKVDKIAVGGGIARVVTLDGGGAGITTSDYTSQGQRTYLMFIR